MSDYFEHRIMEHVTHALYQPANAKTLAEQLGVDEDADAFYKALKRLVGADHLVLDKHKRVGLPRISDEAEGTIRVNPGGFGFVSTNPPTAAGDLFVPHHGIGGALDRDRVRVRVRFDKRRAQRDPGRSPYTAEVIEILERRHSTFAGTLRKQGSLFVVIPDGKRLSDPIVVRDATAKHAKAGDKVVVEMTRFPEDNALGEGVITRVLGEPGKADVETAAVIAAHDLPLAFDDAVVESARAAVHRYQTDLDSYMEDRVDLRDLYIVTIDPPEAQDFDDAISIVQTSKGLELGVHIADVAAFVEPGTALDDEAYKRGNSTYLPRKVIPMLPEVLSNGVCSLQPGVDRLARSAFITYDDKGCVVQTRFSRSLIRSSHRLTYLEAQALIDGDRDEARKHARFDAPYTDRLVEALATMNELAQCIRKRRFEDGMIVLELPDIELIFNDDGDIVDAEPEDDAFTHRIIEMFMVEANEAAARLFADLDVPLIRRVHPDPGAFDVAELRTFAKVAGYQIPAKPTRRELQALLDATRGKPAARAVHLAVLKTLTKAEYAPLLIGHFALASKHYTHFTSPIRRYPDLAVHRALDVLAAHLNKSGTVPRTPKARKQLGQRVRTDPRSPGTDALHQLGSHCSGTEQNSTAAERELRDVLCMKMLAEKHVGDVFAGTVTGVTGRGLFVQIDKYLVEGFVSSAELPGSDGDRWHYQRGAAALINQRSGRAISIGHTFEVKIVKVDLVRRKLDLKITDGAKLGDVLRPGAGERGASMRRKGPKQRVPGRRSAPKAKRKGGKGRRGGRR